MKNDKQTTPHDGARQVAGRKVGSGKFLEPTSVLRIPTSQTAVIKDFLTAYRKKRLSAGIDPVTNFELPSLNRPLVSLPLYSSKVSAGFPSPAEEHVEKRLNPNDFLIDQEDSTFFVTIQGYSMIDAGLMPNDKAVVDRSKNPIVGDIVLAVLNGEFTIKTLGKSKSGAPRLLPANKDFKPIEISEEMQFEIWGVVTGSFRRFR